MIIKLKLIVLTLILTAISFASSDFWQTDFEKASETAKNENKFMLLDFSGSDWCGWCVKLDNEIFNKPAFEKFAKENLVCVMLDFPQSKKLEKSLEEQNQKLAKKYKIKGFPTVLILNPEGEAVEKTGYKKGGPEKYINFIKEVIKKNKKETAPKEFKKEIKKEIEKLEVKQKEIPIKK